MPVRPSSPKSAARRSKAEVQVQFDELRENLAAEKEERSSREETAAQTREKEIRELTQNVTAETVIRRLSMTELDISKALADLSSRLMEECRQLESLKQAVQLENKELERLYNLDVASASLAQLIEDYETKKKEFEAEMMDARSRWSAEKEAAQEERKREQENYAYTLEQERRREEDQHQDVLRLRERENKEKQETLEKTWAVREDALRQKEADFARVQKENAEFPERLKREIERAVAEATQALQAGHKQAFALLEKDRDAERKMAAVQQKGLEDTVARQTLEIKSLNDRLEEAKRQVQDIAVKAIEGASGASALSHINKIAMEQAKTRSQPA